ncbi:MAG TPA: hypothetical protein VMS76_00935 [Planctomycetota bacterium]|nr:hypothetical protein [Planctomycetota bacterium]
MRILASAFVLVVLALTLGLYLARSRSAGPEAMAAQPTAAAPAATGNAEPEALVVPEPEKTLDLAPEPAESAPPPAASAPEGFELMYAGKSSDELLGAKVRIEAEIAQATERAIDQLEAQGRFKVYPWNDGKLEIHHDPPYAMSPGEIVSHRTVAGSAGKLEWHGYNVFPADFPEIAALLAEAEWLKAKTGTE